MRLAGLRHASPAGRRPSAGGECHWVLSRPKFLLHVHPLADHYRTLFRQAFQRDAPDLLKTLPARVWKQRWVVHCQPAGSGEAALRYLSRYVFKTATGDRDLPLLPDGRVRWRYRDSTSGREEHLDVEPFELIRRFLQHVLPSGFHRVRRFGWLHPGARAKLNRVRALLRQAPALTHAQRAAWQPPQPDFEPCEPLPPPERPHEPTGRDDLLWVNAEGKPPPVVCARRGAPGRSHPPARPAGKVARHRAIDSRPGGQPATRASS